MQQALQPLPPASEQKDLALSVAQVMLQGFNKHYRIFREACQAAKRHFETGNWTAVQQAARERIDFYDKRVMEAVEHIERGFRPDVARRCRLGADQAALYRPADLSQAAGVRGDLLQLGVLQNPAPDLLSQQVHFRAAGGVDRAHRCRSAVVSLLLPGEIRPAPDARAHVARHRPAAPVRRPRARSALRAAHVAQDPAAAAAPGGQPPDPDSVVAVLPQQGRLRRRQDDQRQPATTRS